MPPLTRTLRRFTSLVAIAALLFMQLAVSAFACPGDMGGSMTASAASKVEAVEADSVDMSSPLCQAHCAPAKHSVGKVSWQSAVVEMPAAVGSWLAAEQPAPLTPDFRATVLAQAPVPALSLRHCCLRL